MVEKKITQVNVKLKTENQIRWLSRCLNKTQVSFLEELFDAISLKSALYKNANLTYKYNENDDLTLLFDGSTFNFSGNSSSFSEMEKAISKRIEEDLNIM